MSGQTSMFESTRIASAVISACGLYRYRLDRTWGPGPRACWLMLNPSKADGEIDDPTLRRCIGFSTCLGYGSLVVANAFAWRATDPRELDEVDLASIVGPEADRHIRDALADSAIVICGWGASGPRAARARRIPQLLRLIEERGLVPMALATTKAGDPRHPLYLPANMTPRPWPGRLTP